MTGRSRNLSVVAVALVAVLALPGAAAGAQDPVMCQGEVATIIGSDGDDSLRGTPDRDVIAALGGNDVIRGGGGEDLICGGPGDDVIIGGAGPDAVWGDEGNDQIMGGGGSDTLYGGLGSDILSGDAGRDVLYGDEGDDLLLGGPGNDLLLGGSGDDQLRGDGEDDELHGGEGNDELWGDSGEDTVVGNDQLFGEGGDDYLWGDGGDDYLSGGPGDDLLQGGAGADTLQGQAGYDELWGSECYEIGQYQGHFCRWAPSGRPPVGGAADPGDLLDGGPNIDACNRGSASRCETYRGWRRGAPWDEAAAGEWRQAVVQAFEERAAYILEHPEEYPGPPDGGPGYGVLAQQMLDEIEHAAQIVACESLGDPFQVTPPRLNPGSSSPVVGLFQHRFTFWADRASAAGIPGASPFDPLSNARVTAWLVAESIQRWWDDAEVQRPAWVHWACDEALVAKGLWG